MMFDNLKQRYTDWKQRRGFRKKWHNELVKSITILRFESKRFRELYFSTTHYPIKLHSASIGGDGIHSHGLEFACISQCIFQLRGFVNKRKRIELENLWEDYLKLGIDELNKDLESDFITALYKIAGEPRPSKPTEVLESYWKKFIKLTR